jgi:hypothetical protein
MINIKINYPPMPTKRSNIMKTQHILLYLLLAILIATSISIGQKMSVPSEVRLLLDTTQRGTSIKLTIEYSIFIPIKEGWLTMELLDTNEVGTNKTILWQGKSDTSFNRKFTQSINIPEGKKLGIRVDLDYVDLNGLKYGDGKNIFIHRTRRWITYDVSSFGNLEDVEIIREVEEQYGIKIQGLNLEQSEALPPEIDRAIERKHRERHPIKIIDNNTPTRFSQPVVKPKEEPQVDTTTSQKDTAKIRQERTVLPGQLDTTVTKFYPNAKETRP